MSTPWALDAAMSLVQPTGLLFFYLIRLSLYDTHTLHFKIEALDTHCISQKNHQDMRVGKIPQDLDQVSYMLDKITLH